MDVIVIVQRGERLDDDAPRKHTDSGRGIDSRSEQPVTAPVTDLSSIARCGTSPTVRQTCKGMVVW